MGGSHRRPLGIAPIFGGGNPEPQQKRGSVVNLLKKRGSKHGKKSAHEKGAKETEKTGLVTAQVDDSEESEDGSVSQLSDGNDEDETVISDSRAI